MRELGNWLLTFCRKFLHLGYFPHRQTYFTGNPSRITEFPSYGRLESLLTPKRRVSAMLKGGFARTLW